MPDMHKVFIKHKLCASVCVRDVQAMRTRGFRMKRETTENSQLKSPNKRPTVLYGKWSGVCMV